MHLHISIQKMGIILHSIMFIV